MMQLNMDQKRIVENEPNGHSLIKGVAGSGKTTIGIARINFLKNHYCFSNDKILFATYNKTLINYSKKLYDEFEFDELSLLALEKDTEVVLSTIDKIIWKYYYKNISQKVSLVNNKEKYNYLNRAITLVKGKYDTDILDSKNYNFLLDEFEWIKSSGYRYLDEYLAIDRLGRGSSVDNGPSRLRKDSIDREAIHGALVAYENLMKRDKKITFSTMAIRVQDLFLKDEIEKGEFQHIIIDESQDLSKVQLDIISFLYDDTKEYSSIMFLADTTQSIYMKSWLSPSGRSFKSVGFDMQGRSKILSRNYRTTKEISKAAYSLVRNDESILNNENYVKPIAIEKTGEYPVYLNLKDIKSQNEKIKAIILKHIEEGLELYDIAVISKQSRSVEDINDFLNNNDIPSVIVKRNGKALNSNKVQLLTMHAIKGLEYKLVIVANLNDGIIPYKSKDEDQISRERKLLYVAMTRAKEQLYLLSSNKQSSFIKEINNKYLRSLSEVEKFKFKKISIADYRFNEKLFDKFSAEEAIRQWFIDVLIKKYKYEENQIIIEYPVQSFSKTGYVDIAVLVNNKPYIFVELKSYAADLENAKRQLKSYLEADKSVKYGIVSNGKKTIVLTKEGNKITKKTDFPKADNVVIDDYISYKYVDLLNKRNYEIKKHLQDKDMVVLKDLLNKTDIEGVKLKKIESYGEVAAGNLEPIFNEKNGIQNIPENLIRNGDDYFLLKVNGKSMIDVDIEPNDYIVVKKQNFAENRDIVVAVVGDTSTLKRYSQMGGKILLIPENSSYEPIFVNEDELYINGVVVGVIKDNRENS